MEKEGLRQRTELASKKQPEKRVLERENGRGEKPGARGGGGEFGKGRSGTWATLTSSNCSLSPFLPHSQTHGGALTVGPSASVDSCSDRALPDLWRRESFEWTAPSTILLFLRV